MRSKSLQESIQHRRSYYQLSNASPISNEQIETIIEEVVKHSPSAFNSQSARVVLLLGDQHKKLWEIVKDELKKVSGSEEAWKQTENKVNSCFLSGYGTVLFFEDETVIKGLQNQFPLYSQKFSVWSEHSSAIVQILTWLALENEGLGASLQHYDPLIDESIQKEWNISKDWRLIAQMPFGVALDKPAEKSYESVEKRVKVFK
ncbi:MAG TPA: hypothetical protein DDZ96_11990 [Porphyromonadaceae bacterium]|jgi:hypothetical protein|uniref:nitroreductase family protein n=1 Tax=Limibacterium fermenti TaxID=3229863 RepID=UPI000E9B7BF8|nr:hypothetical protein [Porphyromonadaceae bacterium]HBL34519.1 hypothetical protein [Porphyromonadaceae bacterium]HBX19141.1 hypothetical protein [Porphyromonadaceae bacterium]HBX46055.1 hypothetical protein [Porphyromonadaceae bacterium]HCM22177.1 hypothetical protein [Porphyromonadaceae bacterium]